MEMCVCVWEKKGRRREERRSDQAISQSLKDTHTHTRIHTHTHTHPHTLLEKISSLLCIRNKNRRQHSLETVGWVAREGVYMCVRVCDAAADDEGRKDERDERRMKRLFGLVCLLSLSIYMYMCRVYVCVCVREQNVWT